MAVSWKTPYRPFFFHFPNWLHLRRYLSIHFKLSKDVRLHLDNNLVSFEEPNLKPFPINVDWKWPFLEKLSIAHFFIIFQIDDTYEDINRFTSNLAEILIYT